MSTQVFSVEADADKLKFVDNFMQQAFGISFAQYCATVILDETSKSVARVHELTNFPLSDDVVYLKNGKITGGITNGEALRSRIRQEELFVEQAKQLELEEQEKAEKEQKRQEALRSLKEFAEFTRGSALGKMSDEEVREMIRSRDDI